jgi:hypothetical protein
MQIANDFKEWIDEQIERRQARIDCNNFVGKRWRMPFYVLNADEIAELDQPVNGKGVLQSLMRRLQKQFRRATGVVRLTEMDIEHIARYSTYLGGGRLLKKIFGRVLGPTLDRHE